MRAPILPLLLCISMSTHGQQLVNPFSKRTSDPLVTIGLTGSTLNYPGSINTGFSMGVMFDFLKTKDASLSFGTTIKAGMENQYGLGLPMSAAYVLLAWAANDVGGNAPSWPANSNFAGYAEFPLLVHYNFGLGATAETEKRVGFYVGGGMTYVFTGYLGQTGNAESISFYGLEADAGIRLGHGFQLGLSGVFSLRQPLGPITQSPGMFGLTISGFIKGWE